MIKLKDKVKKVTDYLTKTEIWKLDSDKKWSASIAFRNLTIHATYIGGGLWNITDSANAQNSNMSSEEFYHGLTGLEL